MDGDVKKEKRSQALVDIRQVHRVYRQGLVEVPALRGVDLEVEQGEFSVLAGPSGSGKTTLLNMIGCLDQPTKGEVWIKGREISGLNKKEAARFRLENVGFVFQAYNLIPVLSVYENAEFVMMLKGGGAKERRERVMELLERVGLGGMEDRRPHELSGGQQQRVAVVRAIAGHPLLVLADEPTANLDSETSAALLDVMGELNEEQGVTFLFSSHDPVVIERCRRVIRLDSGEIVSDERRV